MGRQSLGDLRGKRVAFGSRDSGQAAILPRYFLKLFGLDPDRDFTAVRFDLHIGKHGDTGASEVQVLNAVARGEVDAGAIGDPYWARALNEGLAGSGKVKAIWTSPPYSHCNFTVRSEADVEQFRPWTAALLAMDYDNPTQRPIMDLEGLKRWVPPSMDGYRSLLEAVDVLRFFDPDEASHDQGQHSDLSCDTGGLSAARGLFIFVTRMLDRLNPGQVLRILSSDPSAEHDLTAWARLTAHRCLAVAQSDGRTAIWLEKGLANRILTRESADWGLRASGAEEGLDTRALLLGRSAEIPDRADPAWGFAPRGAVVEEGGPEFSFDVLRANEAWSESAGELYEQATRGHWDSARDIPWAQLTPLEDELERAICQLMTFLAENEFSALYVRASDRPDSSSIYRDRLVPFHPGARRGAPHRSFCQTRIGQRGRASILDSIDPGFAEVTARSRGFLAG